MEIPDAHYARPGDVSIAEQTVGSRPGEHELKGIPDRWGVLTVLPSKT